MRELLIANADRYILFCHPSGHVEPSGDDLTTTIELAKKLQFGVTLYDHLIIGANACFPQKTRKVIIYFIVDYLVIS